MPMNVPQLEDRREGEKQRRAAPRRTNERRVRIEVGYGLEGTLTDALSKVIIANAIAPRFKAGDFGGGIARGADDIITVLTTDASEWQKRPSLRLDNQQTSDPANWLLIALLIALGTLLIVSPGFRWFFLNVALNILIHSGGSRSGGGFSGGGSSGAVDFRAGEVRRAAAGFGELVMSISAEDRDRISDRHPRRRGENVGRDRLCAGPELRRRHGAAMFIAAVAALALPWLLVAFTAMTVHRILHCRSLSLSRSWRSSVCAGASGPHAAPGPARRGLSRRHGAIRHPGHGPEERRTGILIFVSLAERYARIIADEGIASHVPQQEWQEAVDALVAHMRDGRIADGFIAAINLCGNKLTNVFSAHRGVPR